MTAHSLNHCLENGVHYIEALKMPDVQQKVLAFGGEVVGNSPNELSDFMASERIRWKRVIDTANVTVD